MTLMLGGSPFGQRPSGRFDFDPPRSVRYLEAIPRRVRGVLAGEVVIDSVRVQMLHRSGYLGVWCFPAEDVRATDLAEPVEEGLLHVPFDALDEWYEEDERVYGHARDHFTRIDVIPSSRHVSVSVNGETLAESSSPLALFETGLPTRWYFRREDVRMDRLTACDTTSRCAYKGVATYFDAGDERVIAWTYEDPMWDGERVRGLICFFNERVDLEVDGAMQERPLTPWRNDDWAGKPELTGHEKEFG
jgi:uncharacterized protein (DUF427 family)